MTGCLLKKIWHLKATDCAGFYLVVSVKRAEWKYWCLVFLPLHNYSVCLFALVSHIKSKKNKHCSYNVAHFEPNLKWAKHSVLSPKDNLYMNQDYQNSTHNEKKKKYSKWRLLFKFLFTTLCSLHIWNHMHFYHAVDCIQLH